MIATIRPTVWADLPQVMLLFDKARSFMRKNGNAHQWINGYPTQSFIEEEINAGHSLVCENEDGKIVATFCYILGEDPTYIHIYEGEWLNDKPYGTVHRLASSGEERGVAKACFDWCLQRCSNLRVDTHRDNLPMQKNLLNDGFVYCGIIYVNDGSERLAYQKTV